MIGALRVNQFSYFISSHRPVDIHNVYNAVQVKLLMRPSELTVPTYDEVFRDDDVSFLEISVFNFGAQGPLPSKKLGTIKKIWGQHNFFFLCLTQSEHLMILSFLSYTSHGNNRNTVLESHNLFDYFLFHLFLVCHVRVLPQQLG